MFDHVAFESTTHRRRGGGGKKQRLRRLAGESKRVSKELLADVSFEVHPGEAVALITRNKTLRSAVVRLSAGTFLPDAGTITRTVDATALSALPRACNRRMTIRQNIYALGGLLGMSPDAIAEDFDEIVENTGLTTGIDRYLYTAGKSVRPQLALAVLAAAKPGLVAVDRSLVPKKDDAADKAIELLQGLRATGTAFVLAVENNAQVRMFCDEAFVIEDGIGSGLMPVADAIARFRASRGQDGQDGELDDAAE